MSDNDLGVMTRRAREFLEAGDKVRLVVTFAGRQITHPEFGHNVLNKVLESLSDISKLDRDRHLEGKKLIALISPDKKGAVQRALPDGEKQDDKEENKEINL